MSYPAPSPETPEVPRGARTQEIPAVPPPPPAASGMPATAPALAIPDDMPPDAAPEHIVPGFDRAPAPAAPTRRRWRPDARVKALGVTAALTLLGFLLLQWGLAVGREDLWEQSALWSVFATVCTVMVLAALLSAALPRTPVPPRLAWRIAVAAVCGVVLFWALVVLPRVAENRGFLITAALALLVAAVWLSPQRSRPPLVR